MSTNKSLVVVSQPHPSASIINPTVLPVFQGIEPENQLCGSCAVILIEGVSTDSLRSTLSTPMQLLICCPKCGAYNTLPGQAGH
jgi:hypothetical protein